MKYRIEAAFIPWRFYLVVVFIMLVVVGLIFRMVDLAVIKQGFLRDQGNARVVREANTPAFRGMITDRRGFPFAISTPVYSVWMNPKEFQIIHQYTKVLAQLLGMKSADIKARFNKNKKREFVYLKREVTPEIATKVKQLTIPGVYLQQEYKRYYPEGEVAAQVIGFTNVDEQGAEGLELSYNQWLAGSPGKKLVTKDRLGRVVSDVKILQAQKPGNDLRLSIDKRIQYLAYRELLSGVEENSAASGSVIVLDVKTGEVLAMVNQPSFNPNNRPAKRNDGFRNRAVTDIFEPGSTMKAFSIATALYSGKYQPNSVIDTYPGWIRVDHHVVQDEHNNGSITVKQVLQLSSNVGVTKMILSLPSGQLQTMLHRIGFSESTGIGFPGEQAGVLTPRKDPFSLATLAFGYGVSVTPLQLAQAYSVFANDGVKLPVSLLRLDSPPEGKRVMDPKIASEMLSLLESVVNGKDAERATGESARIPGYRVAGKTGTARIIGPDGYEEHRHVSTFVGIAPVSNPRLVIAVVIHDPQGEKYYGADVAAPIFKKIMVDALRILDVAPDDVKSLG